MILVGDIGFSHRKNGLYSKIVKWVTGGEYTHGFAACGVMYGEVSIIEADLKCQVVSFWAEYVNKQDDNLVIFRPIKADPIELNAAGRYVFMKYAGKTYGFMQIPWFIWSRIALLIGFKASKNWFPEGVICSELLLDFIQNINPTYRQAFNHLTLDEVNPHEIYKIVIERIDLFEKVK